MYLWLENSRNDSGTHFERSDVSNSVTWLEMEDLGCVKMLQDLVGGGTGSREKACLALIAPPSAEDRCYQSMMQ